jgi:hypothetical protein
MTHTWHTPHRQGEQRLRQDTRPAGDGDENDCVQWR